MSSPLAQFENARILWLAPGVRTGGRDGFTTTPGDAYLIRAFLKRRASPALLTDRLGLPAVNGEPLEFQGYCIRHSILEASQIPNFQTVDLSALEWDDTALLPNGIKRDAKVKLFMAGLGNVEARFSDKDGSYGREGIGAITREILGDAIYLEGGQVG